MNSEKNAEKEYKKGKTQNKGVKKFMDEKCERDLCFVMAPHCASLIIF